MTFNIKSVYSSLNILNKQNISTTFLHEPLFKKKAERRYFESVKGNGGYLLEGLSGGRGRAKM